MEDRPRCIMNTWLLDRCDLFGICVAGTVEPIVNIFSVMKNIST